MAAKATHAVTIIVVEGSGDFPIAMAIFARALEHK